VNGSGVEWSGVEFQLGLGSGGVDPARRISNNVWFVRLRFVESYSVQMPITTKTQRGIALTQQ
jgi:hypothetical protein